MRDGPCAAVSIASGGGDDQRSLAALERALVAAQPDGHVRILDQGPSLTRLLIEAAGRGICPEFAWRSVGVVGIPKAFSSGKAIDADRSSAAARQESGEHLSPLEPEMPRLIARGASNREIAQQLKITVGTVKCHVNHVLEKLGAHNRTKAVARARGMGLLNT